MKKDYKPIFIFSLVFLMIDQIIKVIVSDKMIVGQSQILIKNILSLNLVHNTGAAFNILDGNRFLFILIAVVAVLLIMLYIKKLPVLEDIDIFVYSLLIGGIIGNLLDRIIFGYVIDYISLNLFGYLLPIFNLADMFIVISISIIIIKTIKDDIYGNNSY